MSVAHGILAQIPEAAPLGLGNWIIDLAAALSILLLVLKIVDHFTKKEDFPQPMRFVNEQSFADKAETKSKFEALELKIGDVQEKIEGKIEDARKENKTDMDKLFVLTRGIEGKVNYLEGATRSGRISIQREGKS